MTMSNHFDLTLVKMAINKKSINNKCWRGCRKMEPSYTDGENVNWCSHYGKQYEAPQTLKVELPYDLAISPLGIYPVKTVIQKHTCMFVFIAALLTIAKTWNQPKCPLTDEWIKRWYIYRMEYYSAMKIMKRATNSKMNGPRDDYTKWNQKEKDKHHVYH